MFEGAQVGGLIGRTLRKENAKHELCRITGLDPGDPVDLIELIILN